jgi:hypothetical protein
MRLCREHPDHAVGEATVRRYVQVRKRELGLSGREVFVPQSYLPNAVAPNSTSFFAAQLIGPVVAGLFIAKVGSGWAFLLNGLSFGAVLLSMVLPRVQELRTSPDCQS